MCGIVGQACRKTIEAHEMWQMCNSLTHRGPDAGKIWLSQDQKTGLAHRRLAILDLSRDADQPMHSLNKRYSIVFNGEIYNFLELKTQLRDIGYGFRTETDTEVILCCYDHWGKECLSKITGAFAFCIFDSERKTMFIARDRAGEKPLFYFESPETFVCASEIKALLESPFLSREIDPIGLDSYLSYGYVTGARSILKHVKKLPPAHALELDTVSRNYNIWRYWSPTNHSIESCSDLSQLTDEIHSLLQNSISQQMVADVPLGILLSGGIDSSIITAIASQKSSKPVKTYTISFPEHKLYDEAKYAKTVANYFSTDHTELEAKPASIDLLPKLAGQFDEPIADPSMIPTFLVSQLVKKHCTVALGGDGADELFGGYPNYNWLQKQKLLRHYFPVAFRNAISCFADKILPAGVRGRTNIIGLAGGIENSVSHFNIYFDKTTREKLLPELTNTIIGLNAMSPEENKAIQFKPENGISEGNMRLDFETYLPDNILVKVDRASMLCSLEIRAPFLDHNLIEFAFNRVPESLKIDGIHRKILLRNLAQKLLPKELDINRKQGFVIPLKNWLNQCGNQIVKDTLLSADCMFNRQTVKQMLFGQNLGLKNAERLYSLAVFEIWRKIYKIPAL